ncbi:MAG: Transcriptional regulator, XRE family [Candidatus Roizmanbacteria bacterium GW2011_GWA2_37_7]|uniref:Transcriptional regulator, XRE family n=1 Tax=Candidatus Roizmanbacteria bacterium GW2011_GWA2_37_7 TaxID=1618481 RepID=A0A0G0H8L7_9BACT|nr:MAG: Transcriptional regulator, XRE family [Candidatus Roizmanbacteria bacterium GW2011_GWA2_37_7]
MLSVGKLLSKRRIEKGITLKQAEKQIRVRGRYLTAIEEEDWGVFTSRVYIAGAIRSYASYLGEDPEKALAYFRRDYEKKEQTTFKKRLPRLGFLPDTQKLLIGAVSVIFFFFVFYFGYQIHLYLSPPEIRIIAPDKRTFRNVEKIKIVAQTQAESVVTIFGEELFPNKYGIFEYDYPLTKGTNTLEIHVKGPNGKVTNHVEQYTLE